VKQIAEDIEETCCSLDPQFAVAWEFREALKPDLLLPLGGYFMCSQIAWLQGCKNNLGLFLENNV
jgi:hypothetical protein